MFTIVEEDDENIPLQLYYEVHFSSEETSKEDSTFIVLKTINNNPNSFFITVHKRGNYIINVNNVAIKWADNFEAFNVVLESVLQSEFVSIKDDGRIALSFAGVFKIWKDSKIGGNFEKYISNKPFCGSRSR